MNGAESLVRSLMAAGVHTCFANPGTTEMHLVAALDRNPGMRAILTLFEGVASGAADGYWRIAGRPAATLLHCGPGLANALANLHNARRANSAIVNIVGDQASAHRPLDPPLSADTEGWARGASGWVRTATTAATLGQDTAIAVQAATMPPGQIATLIVPADTAWDRGGLVGATGPPPPHGRVDATAITVAGRALRPGGKTVLLLGGAAVRGIAPVMAHCIVNGTGARLFAEWSNACLTRGQGRVPLERLAFVADQAAAQLADAEHLILVGARDPVAFFARPGKPGQIRPRNCQLHILARPDQDSTEALALLADYLGIHPVTLPDPGPRPELATGALSVETVGHSLAALMPEHAIVVDESIMASRALFAATQAAPAHDWLHGTGGAIGAGPPLATGAAVAAPDRRVILLQADGSALYTLQALWTQAREKLDVITVVFANRQYAILRNELAKLGGNPGRTALDLLGLDNPNLDFVHLAAGFGVAGGQARTIAAFNNLLAHALDRSGPFLIEVVLA